MKPDFFISHASEDKADVARPLALQLKSRGFAVWFDEFELRVGDSLTERINDGLARSRYGIVILSQAFFSKRWPQEELNGFMARATATDQKIILPIWHDITKDFLLAQAPILADKLATSTSYGVNSVADDVVRALENAFRDNRDSLDGQWLDRSDGDTVYFQQYGSNALGVYDFSRRTPIGIYKGVFLDDVLHYRWCWVDGSIRGAGRMIFDPSTNTLQGQWWHDETPNDMQPVRYEFVNGNIPNWLDPPNFKRLTMTDASPRT